MCTDGLANVGLGGLDGKLVATCTMVVMYMYMYSIVGCYVHVRVRVH